MFLLLLLLLVYGVTSSVLFHIVSVYQSLEKKKLYHTIYDKNAALLT